MSRKLVFFDIDGTLIGGGSQIIPDSAKWAIEKTRENGHLCVINTGRTKALVGEEITGQVQFDGVLMGCGTHIVYHDKELFHASFTPELSERIIKGLRDYRIDALLEGSRDIFAPAWNEFNTVRFHDYAKRLSKTYDFVPFEKAIGCYDKFFAYVEETERMERFRAAFSKELDFIDRENGFYEIVPASYSKAKPMYELADRLGIPMRDTVAIGDSNNDIPMFSCAGTGIAMGKSSEIIAGMADYITTDVWEDGIRNALSWLGVLG